ncbi:hypothetical protein [Reinekea sp.]|jgi:type VI secretion system protein ImpM|uniref:hypothetical protein n=1 Tax=Reinekea sp. TaxID=1970455 RepID=UPI0039891179
MFGFSTKHDSTNHDYLEPPLKIGYLGKVSFEADFISLNANYREVTEFERIFVGYYSRSVRNKSVDEVCFKGCLVCLAGGDNRQGLFVSVLPSQDSVGRLYPFMVFARLCDPEYYFRPNSLFFLADEVIRLHGINDGNLNAVIEAAHLNALSDENSEDTSQRSYRYSSQRSMEKLANFSCFQFRNLMIEDFKSDWVSILMFSMEQIFQFSTSGQSTRFNGIGLPIPISKCRSEVCLFWLQLIASIMPKGNWRPDIVIPTNTTTMFLLTRPLTESTLIECLDVKSSTPPKDLISDHMAEQSHDKNSVGRNEFEKVIDALEDHSSLELAVALRHLFDKRKKDNSA